METERERERETWFCLVWFWGISTITGYVRPNTIYSCILDVICIHKWTKLNSSKYRNVSSSSSSCRAAGTDIPDPLSPLFSIVHRLWLVFRATSRILTELLYVCSNWLWGSIGVHRLWARPCFSSSPACLICLTWIVFVMGGRWPYSWCFEGCCLQDLFNIGRSILV